LRTDIIRQVLPCATGDDGLVPCAELRATLNRELAQMDERIEALSRSRDLLSGFVARVQ
jgi:hypothetical protein